MPSTTRVGSKTVGVLLIGPPSGSSTGAVTTTRPASSSRAPDQNDEARCGSWPSPAIWTHISWVTGPRSRRAASSSPSLSLPEKLPSSRSPLVAVARRM